MFPTFQNDLGSNLKLNKELAAAYRRLQNQYVALKNDMLNHLDGRVQAETSVKDLKKVSLMRYILVLFRGKQNKCSFCRSRN